MTDDDQNQSQTATLPPPDGEEDLYSASTAVGPASEELLALVRAAEGGTKSEKGDKAPPAKDAKSAGVPDPPKPAAGKAESAKPASAAPKPASAAPKPLPKLSPDEPTVASETTARRRVASPAHEQRQAAPGLPPFISIVLVFLAAVLTLAALIR